MLAGIKFCPMPLSMNIFGFLVFHYLVFKVAGSNNTFLPQAQLLYGL